MFHLRAATSALVALSFVACSGAEQVDLQLDPELSAFQVDATELAGAAWSAFVGAPVVRVTPDGEWLLLLASIEPGLAAGGYTEHKRKLIRITRNTPDGEFYAVVLHEAGHALGLSHTCVPADPRVRGKPAPHAPPCIPGQSRGVMDPITPSTVFTTYDSRECVRVGVC